MHFLPRKNELLNLIFIVIGHLILTKWALSLVTQEEKISLMWLPDGYLLAVLVLISKRLWPTLIGMVFFASLIVELILTQRPIGMIASFIGANLFESVIGALIFAKYCGGKQGLQSIRQLSIFLLSCVLMVPALSALIGAYTVVNYGFSSDFLAVYKAWHSSAGLGILFVTPLVLVVHRLIYKVSPHHLQSRALLVVTLAIVFVVYISSLIEGHFGYQFLMFLTLPILCWSAIKFGLIGAVVASSALVLTAVQLAALGFGFFDYQDVSPAGAVFKLQAYLGAAIVSSLYTAIAIDNLNFIKDKLDRASTYYLDLFEKSPISLWEEDFSKVKQYLDEQVIEHKVKNISTWLRSNPTVVEVCSKLVLVKRVNERTLTMFKADSEQQLLENLYRVFNEASLKVFCEELIALYTGQMEFRAEATQKRLDGELFYTLTAVSLVLGHEHDWSRVVVSIDDISQRKKNEFKLQQAAAVSASTSEGVVVTDLEGKVLSVNPAFSVITGYSEAEVVGRSLNILKSDYHNDDFFKSMWHALKTEGSWRDEIWNRRKDGAVYPELLTINTVYDTQQSPLNYVGVFSDITKLKKTEARLDFLAHHDPLTNLPNRLLFNDRFKQALISASRSKTKAALLFLDLDRFKLVNDSFGHTAGDELLKQVSSRIKSQLRQKDSIARISGDEFVILIEELESTDHIAVVLEKLLSSFTSPFELEQACMSITCSVGVSIFPDDGDSVEELYRNADAAMYRAKEEGRNTYHFYTPEMAVSARDYLDIENDLHQALQKQQFYLVYQPQITLSSGECAGLEVLLRWQHPSRGLISPAEFIPIAEQTGLIREIGFWVLDAACQQAKAWLAQGVKFGRIAVNIAGPQLQIEDFSQVVHSILLKHELPATCLELEVTESFLMKRIDSCASHLGKLREMGVEISIDDFGTGYSSLSYLKALPIDKLKIDQSFVKHIPDDDDDMAIVETIIAMSQALKMKVIAEGVETQAQADFLKQKSCLQGQGYLFSKPIVASKVVSYLKNE